MILCSCCEFDGKEGIRATLHVYTNNDNDKNVQCC